MYWTLRTWKYIKIILGWRKKDDTVNSTSVMLSEAGLEDTVSKILAL